MTTVGKDGGSNAGASASRPGSREPSRSVSAASGFDPSRAVESSAKILAEAIEQFSPTHIVSMVSGGYDSAASDQVARELGVKIDFVMHGNTRCGIPQTTEFVRDRYGALGEYVEADAGTAFEDHLLRFGFFGVGLAAHGVSYRWLKDKPFRKTISRVIRQGKRNVRVLLISGARKDESENRKKHLQTFRKDPSSPNNLWCSLIYDWDQETRDDYLRSRRTAVNPVATQLCRSGECMCGTMQTKQERGEAAVLFPRWGQWLTDLEAEVRARHGFGWGEPFPKPRDDRQADLFQPMCKDCVRRAA